MCGVTKKSGKHSCCAPGGSWFQNCGDFGDSKFDHTWDEGAEACKGKLSRIMWVCWDAICLFWRVFYFTKAQLLTVATNAPIAKEASSSVCPKCGNIKKSGKSSCCARGGSWFQNCGDAGDDNFGHTWLEGTLACKGQPTASARICIAVHMLVYAVPVP